MKKQNVVCGVSSSQAAAAAVGVRGKGRRSGTTTGTALKRAPPPPAAAAAGGARERGLDLDSDSDSSRGGWRQWSEACAKAAVPAAAALAVLLAPQPPSLVLDSGLSLTNTKNVAHAGLPSSNPNKDGRAILRNALPINNKSPIRQVQKSMESISEALRVPGVKFVDVSKSIKKSKGIVANDKAVKAILADIPGDKTKEAAAKLQQINAKLGEFEVIAEKKDKQAVPIIQQDILKLVGEIEEDMVAGFPYEVPADYANLPQLKGRATLELKMKLKDAKARSLDYDDFTMTMVVDGYNAPVTAGNFVDLVKRKFYDGMQIQRSDGFVVQTGGMFFLCFPFFSFVCLTKLLAWTPFF